MKKEEVSKIFLKIADILEMQNIPWKPQAYRVASRSLDELETDIDKIYRKGGLKAIEEIPGIGEGLGKKIVEYLNTGKIQEFERLRKTIPKGLLEILDIPGLGPKKIKHLNTELGIKNIKDLEKAAKLGKIHFLPNFKEKSEKNILESTKLYYYPKKRIPLKIALKESKKILNILKKVPGVKRYSEAGSTRRQMTTIGDLEKNGKSVIMQLQELILW